jgi:hypothetical protein
MRIVVVTGLLWVGITVAMTVPGSGQQRGGQQRGAPQSTCPPATDPNVDCGVVGICGGRSVCTSPTYTPVPAPPPCEFPCFLQSDGIKVYGAQMPSTWVTHQPTDSCTPGDFYSMTGDAKYWYWCNAPNGWVRIPHATVFQ